VKALNTVFADMADFDLLSSDRPRLTGFVAGDNDNATRVTLDLVQQMGFDPLYVGPLFLSRYLEAMSHLNIALALKQHHGTRIGYIYDLTRKIDTREL
jgi:predicted dinucleotide-binding enzyme